MKRFLLTALTLVLSLSLVACGSSGTASSTAPVTNAPAASASAAESADSGWSWERDIEMVCMYDVGSGTDSTLRAICDQVGRELGINIVINNVSGGSGLTGMEYFYTQPADGYTFGMLGISHVLAGLKDTASFDVKNEMTAVSGLVQDIEMIYSNVDRPFKTWAELEEYAKANPGELKLALTSINGVDGLSVRQLLEEAGLDITLVATDSAELYSLLIGGHVDLVVGSPNECKDYVEGGQMNALITINTVRSTAFPDIPCSADFNYMAEIGPWRAIFARTGTPEAAIASLSDAFQKVMDTDANWAEFKAVNGLNDRPAQRDYIEMQAYWLEQFEILGEILEEQG